MRLECIEDIINGMQVFMPSGICAYLSVDNDGNVIAEYKDEMDSYSNTYTQDEFGNIIADGIEIFNEPSQIVMEDYDDVDMDSVHKKFDIKPTIAYELIYDGEPAGYPIHKSEDEIDSYVNELNSKGDIKVTYRKWQQLKEELIGNYVLVKAKDIGNAISILDVEKGYNSFEDVQMAINDLESEEEFQADPTLMLFVGYEKDGILYNAVTDEEMGEMEDFEPIAYEDGSKPYSDSKWDRLSDLFQENKIEDMNKLDKIAKVGKDVKDRQKATSLLDATGLGADVKDEVKKFLKKDKEIQKDESLNEISDELANRFLNKRVKNAVNNNYDDESTEKENRALTALIKRKARQGKKLHNNEKQFLDANEAFKKLTKAEQEIEKLLNKNGYKVSQVNKDPGKTIELWYCNKDEKLDGSQYEFGTKVTGDNFKSILKKLQDKFGDNMKESLQRIKVDAIKNDDGAEYYIASYHNGNVGVASRGETAEEAISNLKQNLSKNYGINEDFNPLTASDEFRYMLLDRMRTDCEYFLGNGNRNENRLWAGNVEDQIQTMKDLYNSFKEKPEWITMEDIENYEKQMLQVDESLNEIYDVEPDQNLEMEIVSFGIQDGLERFELDGIEFFKDEDESLENAIDVCVDEEFFPEWESENGIVSYNIDKITYDEEEGKGTAIVTVFGDLDESLNEISQQLKNTVAFNRRSADIIGTDEYQKLGGKFVKPGVPRQVEENDMNNIRKLRVQLESLVNELTAKNEAMSIKDAKALYKKQGFLDTKDDKDAIEALKRGNYTIKTNSRGTATVVELEKLAKNETYNKFIVNMMIDGNKENGSDENIYQEEFDSMKDAIAEVIRLTKTQPQAYIELVNLHTDEILFDSEEVREQNIDYVDAGIETEEDLMEALEDEMLTDINDLDFPDALADTVETTEDGEILTLEKAVAEIKDEIEDLKDDIKDEIEDLKDNKDNIKDDSEIDSKNDENDENDEILDDTEMEESFKKYLRKGQYEDLNKTKQEIDKLNREGKSADKIKDTITLMSGDEKEEKQATDYAVSKLKESLLNTKYSSKLSNL